MFKFIIDTDKYSGNFEREMCAYLTGQIGDCGVGEEYSKLFHKEVNDVDFDNIEQVAGEHGCYRPCEIEPTPDWFNTGMGNCYRESDNTPKEKILKDYADSVEKYEQQHMEAKLFIRKKLENGEVCSNWTTQACDREIKSHRKRISDAKNSDSFKKCLCYNSIAIFFSTKPTVEQIALMKNRASKFAEAKAKQSKWDKDFALSIEGFRLIEVKNPEVEHEV